MEPTEITREAFVKLVPCTTECARVESTELYHKTFFYVESIDMTLFSMRNYVSFTTQYFILDINY